MNSLFKSPQKWIYKYIPKRQYSDKTYMIPEFLFGCVIEFVETEKYFEIVDYTASPCQEKFAAELKKCYYFVKNVRPTLQHLMDFELTEASNKIGDNLDFDSSHSYEELYGQYSKTEKNLKKQEKEYMEWIVKNVDHLWT